MSSYETGLGIATALVGAYIIVAFIGIVIAIVVYVLSSVAHMKALKALGYANAWLAWIPVAWQYALADAASEGRENVPLFGNTTVPAMMYKLWWIALFVLPFVPVIGPLASVVIRVMFLGNCYMKIFARLDRTDENSQKVIGYVSGFLPIIAVVKFLAGKYR